MSLMPTDAEHSLRHLEMREQSRLYIPTKSIDGSPGWFAACHLNRYAY